MPIRQLFGATTAFVVPLRARGVPAPGCRRWRRRSRAPPGRPHAPQAREYLCRHPKRSRIRTSCRNPPGPTGVGPAERPAAAGACAHSARFRQRKTPPSVVRSGSNLARAARPAGGPGPTGVGPAERPAAAGASAHSARFRQRKAPPSGGAFRWRAMWCAIRTPIIPIQVVVHERIAKTSGIEIKLGKPPDLQAFSQWLSNSSLKQIQRVLGCGRISAWRFRSGKVSTERLQALADDWQKRAVTAGGAP